MRTKSPTSFTLETPLSLFSRFVQHDLGPAVPCSGSADPELLWPPGAGLCPLEQAVCFVLILLTFLYRNPPRAEAGHDSNLPLLHPGDPDCGSVASLLPRHCEQVDPGILSQGQALQTWCLSFCFPSKPLAPYVQMLGPTFFQLGVPG